MTGLIVCGHYEGIDERFIEECVDEGNFIGDFVLTGGEIPAMAVADAVCRLIPGVLSSEECFTGESHWEGLLEYPQYSRRRCGATGRFRRYCFRGIMRI
jgi:tRNA (guanine37-N1)-methyltransferase